MNPNEFITAIAPHAIQDMQKCGIPASLTIAQAILESNWGKSGLTAQANNLFGIKGTGTIGSVDMPTTEYVQGKATKVTASFRKYRNWAESITDHSNLLLKGTKDQPNRYHGVLHANYRAAAEAVWKGGYATDPKYPAKLISIIEANRLDQYDVQSNAEGDQDDMNAVGMNTIEAEKQIQSLTQTVVQLKQRITALEERHHMPAPIWAESAVKAAVKAGILDTPEQSSYDFYRLLTILQRLHVLS
ncbi:glycoside hydrolase family 73 protein [Paenibacillus pini]|uniref:N-acetylmuramoyl-L-alanine amidase n=1 Tax=Paenibacillus pini JCM 16418 TaxID=1236976 RepID=W7YHV0_9BACL|nr:glycoside hydrolase family 73 protein [Paenibacillus pini]GAF08037.1 N-acetylmuramoyl-L-alanine amidase [Paenibacillus pini JCM 16418]